MNRQDIEIIRGNNETVEIKLLGDFTSETAYFTIKEKNDLTGIRYVDLSTGSGVVATYDSPYTTFAMTIPKANTSGLTFHNMVWDLWFNENTAKVKGDVKLIHVARSVTDNLPTSETDLRYVLIDTTEFNENDFIYFDGSNLVNITSYDARNLLCEEGSYITGVVDIFNLEKV